MVTITVKQLVSSQDQEFSDIIGESFEGLEEETDIIMTLALMKESLRPDSKWKDLFTKVSKR
jgi:hypothetical protein